MICVFSCLPGKTWTWRPRSPKSQCRKLMRMCLWNLFPYKLMQQFWSWIFSLMKDLLLPHLLGQLNLFQKGRFPCHVLQAKPRSRIDAWVRNNLGVHTFQGLGRNGPSWNQVVRRIIRDLHAHSLIETLDCDGHPKLVLNRRCLPGCGHDTSATRDIETAFLYRPDVFQLARSMGLLAAEHHTGDTVSLLP